MKIALLNGSPRVKSASGFILSQIKSKLENKAEFIEFIIYKKNIEEKDVEEILSCDTILLASPLYVDALPSHVVQAMVCIEENIHDLQKNIEVFAVSNGGFAEGHNNFIAFKIIANWCEKCGFKWNYGVGIGSAERLLVEKDKSQNKKISLWSIVGFIAVKIFTYEPSLFDKLRKKSFKKVFDKLAKDIVEPSNGENLYIRPFFPKTIFLNNLMTNVSFFVKLKTNGLKIKDIGRKDL